MNQGFEVEAGQMARAVQDFQDAANAMRASMNSLQNDLQGWALTQYKGDQAVAFANLHQSLQDEQKVINDNLEQMSQTVDQSYKQMTGTDAQLRQDFQRVPAFGDGGEVLSRLRNK